MDDFWTDASDSSLGERDLEVLNLITQEALSTFTFDGLKRRLGLHSETLSRILNRLEQEELVEKDPEGYRVTGKISRFPASRCFGVEASQAPLLQTLIPSNVSVKNLVQSLKGKWFGMLRWLGYTEGQDAVSLKWVTEDGSIQVSANISETALAIYAKFLGDKDLDMALTASHQLMTHISKVCSRSQFVRHVGFFGFDGQLMSA